MKNAVHLFRVRSGGLLLPVLAGGLLAAGARADRFGPQQLLTGRVEQPALCVADVDGDGDRDVIVTSRIYSKVSWYENLDGEGAFAGERIISEEAWSAGVVDAADFDGDGDQDVVVGGNSRLALAWYENLDGRGDFGGRRAITGPVDWPTAIIAADLDGDGDQDVVSASRDDDKVAWYENTNGLGSFGRQRVITTSADDVRAAFVADLDGDGDLDVLAASEDDDTLAWYENTDGLGSFGPPQILSTQGDGPRTVFAADLDGDGDRDVILGSAFDDTVTWFENTDGLGSFGAPHVITTQADEIESVRAADVDGDGDRDVLTASQADDTIAWYENTDGAGTFGSGQTITDQAHSAHQVVADDMDGDGDLDVLAATWSWQRVEWYENVDGGGTFGAGRVVSTRENQAMAAHPADVDGDGDQDVVAAFFGGAVTWYPNTDGRGRFGPSRNVSAYDTGVGAIHVADLDGDGDVDVIVADASSYDDPIVWYENTDGLGGFGPEHVIAPPGSVNGPRAVYAADLDGDGDRDVLSASYSDDKIAWYENVDGAGTFGPQQVITDLADYASSVVAADLDGDGDEDVLATDRSRVVWFPNLDGCGTFGHGRVITWQALVPYDAVAADLDGDGDLDVVSGSVGDEKVAWYENVDGLGTFGPQHVIHVLPGGARRVSAADLDGDGDQDVLACSYDGNVVVWFENLNGLGAFGRKRVVTTKAIGPFSVAAADLDGDGDRDVLSASHDAEVGRNARIAWYENRGDGAAVTSRASSANPTSHTALDLPVLGGTYHATVDLGTTGHPLAGLAGFASPDYRVLPGGQVLLVNVHDWKGELLMLPLQAGPLATFDVPIPNDLSFLCFEVFTQTIHVGGGLPFALSNAQDLYLGL